MGLYDLLDSPGVYDWKSRLLGLGRGSVLRYLRSLPQLPPEARVLNVGCGTGRHEAVLSGRIVGVDRNPWYVRHARDRQRGDHFLMDATRLGFGDGAFDFVFCAGLFHHLSDEQVRLAAREMRRVARPDGRVLVIDGVLPSPLNPMGHILFRLDRGTHVRPLRTLEKLLSSEGYTLACPNLPGSFPYKRAVFELGN